MMTWIKLRFFSNHFSLSGPNSKSKSKESLEKLFSKLSMIPKDDLVTRLKRLSMKGLFEMDYNGVDLNLELTLEAGEVANVLYH